MRIANNRLGELFERWYNNQSTLAERKELADLLAAGDLDRTLTPLMKKAWERLQPELLYTEEQIDVLVASILKASPAEAERNVTPVHRVHFLKTSWFRYAAVIIIIAGAATIAVVMYSDRQSTKSVTDLCKVTLPDITPGTNRAILTVDNKKIGLASDKSGITIGSNTVFYTDGKKLSNASRAA